MVQKLIELSLRNRFIVLLLAAGVFVWGIFSIQKNPIDAIPDLSENQVIVFTEWMGRSPQIIEDQVTFPLVSNLQGIPNVRNIRGTSMFGMSFVYIIFDDKTDNYWARTRVLERLNYAQRLLPTDVTPTLGPDGTGVGHVLWYTLDAPGLDLGEQRALQDWYIKFGLQTVPGVAEIASFGGFEKQYQLVVDPVKLQFYNVSLTDVMSKVIANIKGKLGEEMLAVSLIVILFLFHWRSAMSIIIQIPITIAISFILLNAFGLSSNIMSLTGIALAIGVIVDNGIIMSENSYRNLSEWQNDPANKKPQQ